MSEEVCTFLTVPHTYLQSDTSAVWAIVIPGAWFVIQHKSQLMAMLQYKPTVKWRRMWCFTVDRALQVEIFDFYLERFRTIYLCCVVHIVIWCPNSKLRSILARFECNTEWFYVCIITCLYYNGTSVIYSKNYEEILKKICSNL